MNRDADGGRRRRPREEERRRVAVAEHPGGEYLGGCLVHLPDGHVARSSATASNADLGRAIGEANDAVVEAMLAQGRSLANLVGDDGVIAEFQDDERRRADKRARALKPASSALMPSSMEPWKPSWTYLASSPSPSCSESERVLKESSIYPISDGCNFSGGSSNGTSVFPVSVASCPALSPSPRFDR
jgi:hypothetical protein